MPHWKSLLISLVSSFLSFFKLVDFCFRNWYFNINSEVTNIVKVKNRWFSLLNYSVLVLWEQFCCAVQFLSLFQLCSQALECPATNNQGSRLLGGVPLTSENAPVPWMNAPCVFLKIKFMTLSPPPPPRPFSTLCIEVNRITHYKSGHHIISYCCCRTKWSFSWCGLVLTLWYLHHRSHSAVWCNLTQHVHSWCSVHGTHTDTGIPLWQVTVCCGLTQCAHCWWHLKHILAHGYYHDRHAVGWQCVHHW